MHEWQGKLKDGIKKGKIKLNLKKGGRGMRTAHSILNSDYKAIAKEVDVVSALRTLNDNLKLLLIVELNIRTNQIVIAKARRKVTKQPDGSYIIDGVKFPTLRDKTSKFLEGDQSPTPEAPKPGEEKT